MAKIKFRVLTHVEAATKGILKMEGNSPYEIGAGPDDYVCGKCDRILFKSVTSSSKLITALNAAFNCNNCNSINVVS